MALGVGEPVGLRWATAGPVAVQATSRRSKIASAARITLQTYPAVRNYGLLV
jgi:hypothetical protein